MNKTLDYLKKNPFKDKDGKIVIVQFPNWQLVVAITAYLAQAILPEGEAFNIAKTIQIVSLTIWAYEELMHGVNLFRRILGLVVLISMVVSVFNFVNY